ncbi:hypothetical protein Tco_1318706 [Tanacetum coccineum]
MNYYRPPPVQLDVLDLQRVPAVPAVLSPINVKWSPVPVVTASMSKSAQAAPVGYGQMYVMLQSLPTSCGLPVASLNVPMPLRKPEPPDLVVVQSHSAIDYHQPMSQHEFCREKGIKREYSVARILSAMVKLGSTVAMYRIGSCTILNTLDKLGKFDGKVMKVSLLGFLGAIYEGKTHQDLHTCLFACFLSQEEPKRVSKALSDPAWVEAMQEELLQFKLQNVWVLVDLPNRELTQVEGIDYDEVFCSNG